MMLAKEKSALKEEKGVDKEEGREVGAASIVSTRGHFAANYATLF